MCPKISVIIAVYNGEKYIKEAIDSLLAQTYPSLEIIVIDDGSQDGTEKIVKGYGEALRYFFQPNQGQPVAMNLGLSLARGKYVTFLDADDIYTPTKLALQIEFLEKNPHLNHVFGHIEHFLSPDIPAEEKHKWKCPQKIQPTFSAATGLFEKALFDEVGGFNPEQRIGNFIEWYIRAKKKGLTEAIIPEKVLMRRIHQNNMTSNTPGAALEYLKIIKASLSLNK